MATIIGTVLLVEGVLAAEREQPHNTLSVPARIAGSRSEPQVTTVETAFTLLEQGDADGAITSLETLLTDLPPGHQHQAAKLLHGQLTGAFRQRQARWLSRAVADLVVLVPDETSFIVAIDQWTDDMYWPVLIEDSWFAPMFVQSFGPKVLARWSESLGMDRHSSVAHRIRQVITNHNSHLQYPSESLPPGIVVVDVDSSLRAGGLALAVGRAQPLFELRASGRVRTIADTAAIEKLNNRLLDLLSSQQLIDERSWCGISLAGPYPYRYRSNDRDAGVFAVDDRLGRHGNGDRIAVVGRLTGNATQSVYQAMCSLFLQPRRVLLANTYGKQQAIAQAYAMVHANRLLAKRYTMTHANGSSLNIQSFRKLTQPVNPYDMIWANSSGGPATWRITGGSGTTADIPIGRPAMIHMTHSFSAADPWNVNTLAGRAIVGGTYWYFGSVHEPYVQAFAQPTGMALRVLAGTPVAFAARRLRGQPMSTPWKLMLIGDPLFTLRAEPVARAAPPTIKGTTRVTWPPPNDATLGHQLRDAVMIQPDAALEIAGQCVQSAATLDASDLARTALVLWAQEQGKQLIQMDPHLARRHPIARGLQIQSVHAALSLAMSEHRLDDAQGLLLRLFAAGVGQKAIIDKTGQWFSAMEQLGRQDQAFMFLKTHMHGEWPIHVKQALRSMHDDELRTAANSDNDR